jgi:hypothetical protein
MVADSTGGTVGLQDKTTSGLKAVSRMPPDYLATLSQLSFGSEM